jgi:hypothetical protein
MRRGGQPTNSTTFFGGHSPVFDQPEAQARATAGFGKRRLSLARREG